jgi:hypothetical protein
VAKFEGNYPSKPKDMPAWFTNIFDGYQLIIKYLIQIGKSGVGFSDIILNSSFNARIEHSKPVRIPHNLLVTPTSITIQGGRVESYSVLNSDAKIAIVNVRLLSTPVTDTVTYSATLLVNVLDPTLFRVGDSVLIGSQTRKITAIVGSRLSLDLEVLLQPPCVVTLNQENLNFVLF